MPFTPAFLFRFAIVLVMAAHVFVAYCTARTMGSWFGFDLERMLNSAAAAAALALPLVWLAGLPELPEIWHKHVRARRRWRRGGCPECGYSLAATPVRCPECGRDVEAPSAYRFTVGTLIRFAAMLLIAWIVGVAAGEWWIAIDEAKFIDEANAALSDSSVTVYQRDRLWPCVKTPLIFHRAFGITHDNPTVWQRAGATPPLPASP